ncbi:hypothetical protein JW935_07625 [candidate division KSB1 bacterium]|nr:hypothetical protein [candidate division KSB1 bacterium]
MKNRIKTIIIFCLLALPFSLQAGGKYAGASMELGVGARPLGLAGAAAAMQGKGDCFYFNPASLAFIERSAINLLYAPSYGSVTAPMAHYHHAGLALPLPTGGTVAVNWTRFSVDEIPIYPKLQGNSFSERKANAEKRPDGVALGYFEDREDVYYFSFSRCIKTTLPLGWLYLDLPVEIPVGVNFKFLQQQLYRNKASGIGMDMGIMMRFSMATLFDLRSLGNMTIGFSVLDISKTNIIWDTKQQDRIARTTMVGLSYDHPIVHNKTYLKIFWTRQEKYDTAHLFGLELSYGKTAIRIGKNRSGFTAGAGLFFRRVFIDYAFVTADFDYLHRLSCTIQI